ncbi:DNA adenine methylase [Limosilactobacillus fermentum]|uniref:DNA adenine methylase n=1 Tax=Limosilactobacillus fermentum TaxID=1613 RepID=UPI003D7877D4
MMTTKQAEEKLSVTRQTLYLWRKQGLITVSRRQNGQILWDELKLLELKNKREKQNNTQSNKGTFEIQNRRYLGSKEKLLPFIREVVHKHTRKVKSVADIFGGTGVVADMFAGEGKHVIINDILHSNYLVYQTFFGNEEIRYGMIKKALEQINSLTDYGDGYLEKTYGDKYFSLKNANKIGSARQWIEDNKSKFNSREYAILITSIIYGSDKVANTVGHYDAYRKKMDSFDDVVFKMPVIHQYHDSDIYKEDANKLVRHIYSDLIYIDTPYNSRQYVDTYHVLENISDWNKPNVIGVARKSIDRKDRKSKYNLVSAPQAFDDLISHINAKYVLVSFNNMSHKGAGRSNSKISHDEIMNSLSKRGHVSVFSKKFKPFSSGKSNIKNHQELLYLLRVKQHD